MRTKKVWINNVQYPSMRAAARYIIADHGQGNENTIAKELQRIHQWGAKPWKMYGKYRVTIRPYQGREDVVGKPHTPVDRLALCPDSSTKELEELLKRKNITYHINVERTELLLKDGVFDDEIRQCLFEHLYGDLS